MLKFKPNDKVDYQGAVATVVGHEVIYTILAEGTYFRADENRLMLLEEGTFKVGDRVKLNKALDGYAEGTPGVITCVPEIAIRYMVRFAYRLSDQMVYAMDLELIT